MRTMRSPMRRRSASIWVSPGPPRKPKPPRWRSRWVQERTAGSVEVRCASSTCNAPSLVRARRPKISRIKAVRSTPWCPGLFQIALLHGRERASKKTRPISCAFTTSAISSTLPEPMKVAGLCRRGAPARGAPHPDRWRAQAPPHPHGALGRTALLGPTGRALRETGCHHRAARGRRLPFDAAPFAPPAARSPPVGSTRAYAFSRLVRRIEQLHGMAGHDGGDGVLVHELGVAVAPRQQDAEVVEPGDDALQLHSVDEEDGVRGSSPCVRDSERVLKVLCAFRRHFGLRSSALPHPSPAL